MTAPARTPTEKQLVVLRYLQRHQEVYGWMPTFREIADHLGTSRNSMKWVTQLLEALEDRGLIERLPHTPRAIRITRRGRPWLRVRADWAAP